MNNNARQIDEDSVAAVPISPEFLAGSTEAGLEKIRTRLLDLTNRNRLLNFRHTASALRVVDVGLNAIYVRLLIGEKLLFSPVPSPDVSIDELTTVSAADHAQELGWRVEYDLENAKDSKILRVLHFPDGLETLTRKIGSAAKTAVEESGTNMLYLIFGFLEWYEADDSRQQRYAPLLTVPVALDRKSGDITVEYSGEDLTSNLSLLERMRRDFGLDIPVVQDEDTPEKYFARFSQILDQKKRWRIRRQITLSLLSFGKLLMYRDLDPNAWPGITGHTLVKELFEGKKKRKCHPCRRVPD